MRSICAAVILLIFTQSAVAQNWSFFKKDSKAEIAAKKELARKAEAKRSEKEIRSNADAISSEEIEEYKRCIRARGWAYCIASDRFYWDEAKESIYDRRSE